jgi:HlyD family secretion protein
VALALADVKAHLEADRTVLGYATSLSASTLATYQANVSTALASLDAALQSLSADKSSVELQVRLNDAEIAAANSALSSAEFAVDAAENALAQAKADLALKQSGNRPEVIAAQRANVAAQEATLAGLLADLAKRSIVAPLDSVVTDVAVSVGETAQPGMTVIELNAHGTFEIVANISEVDIANIAVGQPVRITLDAFPTTEAWTGKVAFIDPAEKVLEGVIFYETKVVFDQEDARIRSGMTANLEIETARREDALRVPIRALSEKLGKTYADKLVDGAPVETEISVGIEDDEFAEMLSGLAEGDQVVTGSSEE